MTFRSRGTGDVGPLSRIHLTLESLTKADQKLAQYVLEDPDRAAFSSITLLARNSDVSESAVSRFCKRLGYTGYQSSA
jgi:DNA-binding MurR/RpiR family transcriptional regulator